MWLIEVDPGLVVQVKPIGLLYARVTFDPKFSGKRCLHVGPYKPKLAIVRNTSFCTEIEPAVAMEGTPVQ